MFRFRHLPGNFKVFIPKHSFSYLLIDKFPLFIEKNEKYILQHVTIPIQKIKYHQVCFDKEKYGFHFINSIYCDDSFYKTYSFNIQFSINDVILSESFKYYRSEHIEKYNIRLGKNGRIYHYSYSLNEKYEKNNVPQTIKDFYVKIKNL
jgi:hypothetical protein